MINTPEEHQKMFEVEEQLWWYKALHQFVLKAVKNQFGNDKSIKILDVACGTGGLLLNLTNQGYKNLKGIDHAKAAVKLSNQRGLNVSEASMCSLDLSETFDVIICNDALCYLNDDKIKITLANFKRHLAPNGIIISNNNAFDIFWGTHDIAIVSERRFVQKEFNQFLKQTNLKINHYTYWTFILSPMVLAIRLKQRIGHFLFPKSVYYSDVNLPENWLNTLLFKIVIWENKILKFQPFGSSLFWIASH